MKMANMDDYFDVVIVGTGAAGVGVAVGATEGSIAGVGWGVSKAGCVSTLGVTVFA